MFGLHKQLPNLQQWGELRHLYFILASALLANILIQLFYLAPTVLPTAPTKQAVLIAITVMHPIYIIYLVLWVSAPLIVLISLNALIVSMIIAPLYFCTATLIFKFKVQAKYADQFSAMVLLFLEWRYATMATLLLTTAVPTLAQSNLISTAPTPALNPQIAL
jgi:hypothetical protein